MKWSLRTILVIVAIIATMLAWRANFRIRLIKAALQIQGMGGEISYQSQHPRIGQSGASVTAAYAARPLMVSRTLDDGTTITESQTQSYTAGMPYPFLKDVIHRASSSKPTPFTSTWFGNQDVIVEAVRVDESDVDEKFVQSLCELPGLRIVQVSRNREYFRVKVCSPVKHQVNQEQLDDAIKEKGQPFEKARSLIHAKLPGLQIIEGLADR